MPPKTGEQPIPARPPAEAIDTRDFAETRNDGDRGGEAWPALFSNAITL
jgi:hypothetical protein